MTDHPEQYVIHTHRMPKRMQEDLKKLAKHAGTDLTGYINSVVFFTHLYKNEENVKLLNALNQVGDHR